MHDPDILNRLQGQSTAYDRRGISKKQLSVKREIYEDLDELENRRKKLVQYDVSAVAQGTRSYGLENIESNEDEVTARYLESGEIEDEEI